MYTNIHAWVHECTLVFSIIAWIKYLVFFCITHSLTWTCGCLLSI